MPKTNLQTAQAQVADDGTITLTQAVTETIFQGSVADAQAKVDEIQAAIDFFNQTSADTLANLQQSLADAQAILDTVSNQ